MSTVKIFQTVCLYGGFVMLQLRFLLNYFNETRYNNK